MTVRKIAEVKHGEALTLDPRGTGRFLVRIIDEGEGSSAVYPAAALQKAAEERVFAAGTHMYLDHAPDSRRGVHGERSIRDLASVLTSDAVYDPTSRALVGEAQAVAGWEHTLEGLAPHVGLSISGLAEVEPPADQGGKPIVTQLLAAESVDWVVKAGRGGAVMAILESAGHASEAADETPQIVPEANSAGVTTSDEPEEVTMSDTLKAELEQIREQLATVTAERDEANAKLAEAAAATITATNTARITEATKDLPEQMATRIASLFAGRADEVTEADLTAAVDAEKSYALSLTESGRLTGFGATTTDTAPVVESRGTYTNAFGRTIEEN